MPFLKEFIINDKTKIKLWKVIIGELNSEELNSDEKNLLKLKKNNILREQFLATRKLLALENSNYKIIYDMCVNFYSSIILYLSFSSTNC